MEQILEEGQNTHNCPLSPHNAIMRSKAVEMEKGGREMALKEWEQKVGGKLIRGNREKGKRKK